MMPLSDFRRQLKNTVLYTPVETKVRDATSNDIMYPSTKKLSEIAEMTHDPFHFVQIMNILWKRLNDGMWRHVLKALSLLEHLLKRGHLMVVEKCQENVYLVCMLRTYQCVEDGIDRGVFIRERAEVVYKLLNEPDFLAAERGDASLKVPSLPTLIGSVKAKVPKTPVAVVSKLPNLVDSAKAKVPKKPVAVVSKLPIEPEVSAKEREDVSSKVPLLPTLVDSAKVEVQKHPVAPTLPIEPEVSSKEREDAISEVHSLPALIDSAKIEVQDDPITPKLPATKVKSVHPRLDEASIVDMNTSTKASDQNDFLSCATSLSETNPFKA